VPQHELLTTQRNDVLAAITDSGLNPVEFEWGEVMSDVTPGIFESSYTVQSLLHVPTGAAFVFDIDSSRADHYAIFYPGTQGPTEKINAGEWHIELGYVQRWLTHVKREHDAPDLWAEIQQRRELIAGDPTGAENSPFTPEEQGQIATQLREISEYVRRTYDLPASQQAAP
jgi:hypothetical protein